MKDQKLRAREFLQRTARVKEMQAAAMLAQAVQAERVQQEHRDAAQAACDAVAQASRDCAAAGAAIDLNRYVLLSQLGLYTQQRLREANGQLAEATSARERCAEDNVQAKRRHERAEERAGQYRVEQHRLQAAKREEDAIERWVDGKERP